MQKELHTSDIYFIQLRMKYFYFVQNLAFPVYGFIIAINNLKCGKHFVSHLISKDKIGYW